MPLLEPALSDVAIYVHWPFCQAKCPYCDFNSHVSASIDHEAWTREYLNEIDRLSDWVDARSVTSVFFGGGTPSLMQPRTVAAILSRIANRFRVAETCEITLEANPTSVEGNAFTGFAAAGVNRVSLGVQSLRDDDLRRLGRLHTAQEAVSALEVARKAFDRVSMDLIYARQDQTVTDWSGELGEALDLGTDHLSLYQLTIENGTAFGDRYAIGKLSGLPTDDTAAEMFDATQDLCNAAGMPAYEVSNHAEPGQESRHNLSYWRYDDYAGVGPGAHGRLTLDQTKVATYQTANPKLWLAGDKRTQSSVLSGLEQAEEALLMGLRLPDGVDTRKLGDYVVDERTLDDLSRDGYIQVKGSRISVPRAHWLVLNAIIERLALNLSAQTAA